MAVAYERYGNKFFKRGFVPMNPKKQSEGVQSQITARFEVGPGGAQVTIEDLDKAIKTGEQIVKRHHDGKRERARIDVYVPIADNEKGFTTKELKEIRTIMAKEFEAQAVAKAETVPAAQAEVAVMSALLSKALGEMKVQAKQIEALQEQVAPADPNVPVEGEGTDKE